jgi:hypothetical protein
MATDNAPFPGQSAVITDATGKKLIVTPGESSNAWHDMLKKHPDAVVLLDGKPMDGRPTPVEALSPEMQAQAKNAKPLEAATPIGEAVPVGETGRGVLDSVAGAVGDIVDSPGAKLVGELGQSVAHPIDAAMEGARMGLNALNTVPGDTLKAPGTAPVAMKAPATGEGSVSMRMPGSGIPGMGEGDLKAPKFDAEAEIKHANAVVEAEYAKAEAQQELGRIYRQKQEQQAKNAADMLAVDEAGAQELDKHDGFMAELKSQLSQLDPTIDPNRYWKNKSAGEVASGAIAGFLFGLTGQGMQYLQTVQHQVDRDVDAQKATYENASAKIRQQMALEGDDYARARQRGLDQRAAKSAAMMAKLQALDSGIAAATSDVQNVEILGRANTARQGLKATINMRERDFYTAAQQTANQTRASKAQMLSAQASWANSQAAQLRASSASGGRKISATIQKNLADLDNAVASIEKMQQLSGGNVASKLGEKIAGSLPGRVLGGRDAAAKDKQYGISRFGMMTDLAKGALQKHELDAFKELLPERTELFQDNPAALDAAKKLLIDKRNNLARMAETGDVSAPQAPVDSSGFVADE